jgi:hypothetical protein
MDKMISWVYGPAVKRWSPRVKIGHQMCGDRGCTLYAPEYEEHVQTVISSLPDRMFGDLIVGEGDFSECDYVIAKSNNAGPLITPKLISKGDWFTQITARKASSYLRKTKLDSLQDDAKATQIYAQAQEVPKESMRTRETLRKRTEYGL